ncbi:hypothetical protein MINT15_04330 [Saccharomonospora viridis]|uniref:Uncharacterized protein n=1 Tax=Saccharomonospora viridis TaxID=1852 RepID=A0A837DFS1_9PSEU|nr:hypothetical protein MINT15_04330 [Saccharomonospora viridis]
MPTGAVPRSAQAGLGTGRARTEQRRGDKERGHHSRGGFSSHQ